MYFFLLAPKGRPKFFRRCVRTPLQGWPTLRVLTQGFTLGYVRSPLWGCPLYQQLHLSTNTHSQS